MADAHGLGPCSARSGGSSPLPPTHKNKMKNKKILEGTIRITGKGVGYFENPDALNRDRVKVEILGTESRNRQQARVVEILERHKIEFVGKLEKPEQGFFLIPDDKRMYRD